MSDKRLNKIMALLAQAEGTNHPEEAKAFTAKAQELMSAWEIDEAIVAQARAERGEKVDLPSDEKVWIKYSPYQTAIMQLWVTAVEANGAKCVWLANRYNPELPGEKGGYLHLFGFETQLKLAQMLAASLQIQADREFLTPDVQRRMKWEAPKAGHRIRWRNGFVLGYAAGARLKLAEAKRYATRSAGTGAELVLIDREALVQQRLDETYKRLSKSSAQAGANSGSAARIGVERGKLADVGQDRVGGTGRKVVGA